MEKLRTSRNWLIISCIALLFLALISCAGASCPPGGCGGSSSYDDWESSATNFLSSDVPTGGTSSTYNAADTSFKAKDAVKNISRIGAASSDSAASMDNADDTPNADIANAQMDNTILAYRSDLFPAGNTLKAMQSVSSSDLVLDVSGSRDKGDAHIPGDIYIPFNDFLYDNGTVKSIPDLSEVLGSAGISNKNPIVVYSDNFESGDGAFAFWIMRYLGKNNVKLLDGDLHDWINASLPLGIDQRTIPPVSYIANPRPQLLANYDYVKSGNAQIVDARSFLEFGKGSIPSAFLISPDEVLEGGRIKDADGLTAVFAKLDKGKPVVVYSSDMLKASLVWYALQLMGFDSRIYTWQDWQDREQSDTYNIN
jgi:thiosulfate/3-mercaptopyruvate sulfurtransferase